MDLGGMLLIAMPGLADPRFGQSVVLICAHSDEGAMGLIVNKPLPDLRLSGLLAELKMALPEPGADRPVFYGGPVERGRGFVLHEAGYEAGEGTMAVAGGFGLSATTEVLAALAAGAGPEAALVALGYAGWGPGQLEGELARNDWLTVAASPALVFAPDTGGKWGQALAALGISAQQLSGAGGRA